MFPRPERRDAVAVHKKHAKKGGCAASKAPADALCAPLATLNIAYPKLRVAHLDPLVLSVDDFLSDDECDELIGLASHADDLTDEDIVQVSSKTFGASPSTRTSTSWFVAYQAPPHLQPSRPNRPYHATSTVPPHSPAPPPAEWPRLYIN